MGDFIIIIFFLFCGTHIGISVLINIKKGTWEQEAKNGTLLIINNAYPAEWFKPVVNFRDAAVNYGSIFHRKNIKCVDGLEKLLDKCLGDYLGMF